jgi:hypothetical protein
MLHCLSAPLRLRVAKQLSKQRAGRGVDYAYLLAQDIYRGGQPATGTARDCTQYLDGGSATRVYQNTAQYVNGVVPLEISETRPD